MGRFWEKCENILLFLWIFLIPTQLGKHFWPEWSHVVGVRSDYLGPILYFSDLVWVGWMICKIFNLSPKRTRFAAQPSNFKINKFFSFENFLIVIFVILNVVVAGNKPVAIYKWLRVIQWIISLKVLMSQKLLVKKYLLWIIPWWIGVESLLGLSQIIKGGSLQGIWYWMGERRFTLTTIGVAQISIMGEGLVRAYGTFSHPNSLAGFLLVSMLLFKNYYSDNSKKVWFWIVTWLAVIGIIITGSRTVWVLLILSSVFGLPLFNQKNNDYKKIIGYVLVIGGVFSILLGVLVSQNKAIGFVGGWDNDSVLKRVNLNMVALKMWRENYMLGVGAGNFVAKLPEYQSESKYYWLQPVHNIFLLAGTEMGMLGIILIIFKLQTLIFKKINKGNWMILGVVVVTGLMDHYWITLSQNYWLLGLILAMI